MACGLAVVVLQPFFASHRTNATGPTALGGEPAPLFALRDDRGDDVSLERYRGRIVVMNLWASWCPPCRAEMPDLQRLADRYGGRRMAVVGVNEGESPERARAFEQSLRIRFPIWIDSSERYGRTYAALGLPTTILIDPHGVVIRGFDGAMTFDQMHTAIDGLIPNR